MKLVAGTDVSQKPGNDDKEAMLHELQVHQIELEMQNEALQNTQRILQESLARYSDLYDSSPVGYISLNGKNQITELNLTSVELLGLGDKNIEQKGFLHYIAPESRDDWHRHFHRMLFDGGRASCELIMRRQDASTFPARLDCLLVENSEPSLSLRVALTDITEIRQNMDQLAEQSRQLREADRSKDQFLAMLAHELRNPLAPIRNAVQILKFAQTATSRIEWCGDVIERQVEHLVRIVDDLLDVSRINRGQIELKKESMELRDFIHPAVEACQPLIDARRQKFSLALPSQPLKIEGDRIRLSQVISNLINNAAKYTEEGGSLGLTAELDGNQICIRVYDSGCGIDQADLPRLFDMFYQADRNLDRSQGGLGIGLSLVQRLIEEHGGQVQAFSAGRGHGSEFVIRLPLQKNPEADFIGNKALETANERKLRILVVDDNRDAADSLSVLLKLEGHTVKTAYDGRAALAMAQSESPEVMLLDIGLPEIDGYKVAATLRRDKEAKGARLIAMTGYGQPQDQEKSFASGFDAHLVKPVDFGSLMKLLND
ncbi:MAG: ATP-binding protein [Methylomonas sp.]